MKNKWAGHPIFDYATFKAYALNVFGHKCICELLQDGEIWSEDEYWGSKLYDFDNNKYYYCGWYIQTSKEWEELLTKWKKIKKTHLKDLSQKTIMNMIKMPWIFIKII